jgi:hypothetical protein
VYGTESETESWSYGASWTVTNAIIDEVGLETLAQAVQAADGDHISYLGEGDPEPGPVRKDWRLYLDLIENHGDVTDDAITDIFTEWVLVDMQLPTLETRAASRARYADLRDAGVTWVPPFGVRDAMSDWRFPAANELMDEANTILDGRDSVLETLAPLDATLPTELEAKFEAAEDDFTETTELLADVTSAADSLGATNQRIERIAGPLQWAGGIGTEYPADLTKAVSAFEDGNLPLATRRSIAIDEDIEQLRTRGAIRIAIVVTAVLVILVIIILLIRRRRRKRRNAMATGVEVPTTANAAFIPPAEWEPPSPVVQ